ncbi:hypothetical protein P3X46_006413 [Hevea brasiliensis]|uniref:DUF7794 domain-containing protein n=1 Tax=Hevea brasiliensis TaxID=3981 RepID=A0ABQ9MQ54_HEVBR|nr:uncharacterized protein LOC110665857 [Hevea brasiliensis]KAJ9182416.1 hypothetical protein P3X46_006413 [Hevea brasiliensis]KAJ9182417.1 hypothetical protein P3X46_006413 [Hevea brasiliensis]
MDFHIRSVFLLLIVSSLLCSIAKAETSGSVFFIDGQNRQYLRTPSTNDVVQSHSMSPLELGAAVSVLLGFAPPATLSAAGSSKLNEVLLPNPFDRPRTVFMLEVTGVNDLDAPQIGMFSNAFRSKVILDSDKAQIELPDEEVSVVSLDETSADCNDEELSGLAFWLGGSYAIDALEPQNGKLIIPLASGVNMNLHVSKKADQEFMASLLALFRNSRRAVEMHEDLSQATQGPAELIMGRFDGVKALQEQYGPEVVEQGLELLLATLSKMLDSFQAAYKGQFVGVIICNEIPSSESGTMLNLMLTSRPSARWLAEKEGSNTTNATTIAEIALVRKTLAWVTGIILLISTLLGIYLLLNMPLTRDTLLYSNVKLD